MKMTTFVQVPGMTIGLLTALLLSGPASAQTANWDIDPAHSSAQFTIRHFGIANVNGVFTKLSGKVQLNSSDITKSSVEATIDVNSVDTRVEARDKDLRSANFFDVARYPVMTFRSKRVAKNGDRIDVTGDLTIRGATHEVTFQLDGLTPEMTDPWGSNRRGFSAATTIIRKEFNLTYNDVLKSGEAVLGDTVKIQLEVELSKNK